MEWLKNLLKMFRTEKGVEPDETFMTLVEVHRLIHYLLREAEGAWDIEGCAFDVREEKEQQDLRRLIGRYKYRHYKKDITYYDYEAWLKSDERKQHLQIVEQNKKNK
jgi:hypothetical protein